MDDNDQANSATLGFEHYVFVLRRQWRLLVVTTVLGALAAVGYLLIAPQTVTATTTINLNVITTEPFSAQRAASGLLDDATETAIARSHVVASRAADLLEGDASASEIRSASTVATSSGAAVVTVDYDAPTAAAAVRGADAVASAYLSFRSEQAQERITVMVTSLNERIDALNTTLGEVNQQLVSAAPNSAAFAQATTQREQIITELDGLLTQRNGLQSVDTTGGIVLSAAEDNELAVAPGRTVTLLTGLAAGLVVGIIAAFVRNPFDRRLRNASEMTRALGAPVFATLDANREDVPAKGPAADALRVTRERLLVDIYLGTTVLVIDATHSHETSPTAVNLAIVTAQVGHDVQLIVPAGSDEFRAHLANALELQETEGGTAVSATVPTLRVFTASDSGDERQGDLLLTEQTHAAIAGAGDETLTFLVLPSSAHPASILAGLRLSQSVVVVTREHDTTTTEIRWLREEAEAIDTPVLGAVAERRIRHGRREAAGISWPFPTRSERGTAARANARAAAKVEVGADS
ncbi:Wzz/FepE/Etk N-terminal domain-containing protein [uncultured Microbacterium sp.]|uniref:Wzz/FepE/Etk N-terminal domain-containing protein n=1 Tax=uncultured Microbacterium sp. TaxID=191216 RepID=UPI0028D38FE7|nr:Wzz/FepE/Etk N-terminal domain-containing protein [uncultured Microbacterium sp.]